MRLLTATAMLLLAGCEQPNDPVSMHIPPKPLRLAAPESSYRLPDSERAKLQHGFDADALERLLSMIRPEMREDLLKHFQIGDAAGRPLGRIVQMYDPQLQSVLEEVWAPMWDDFPDEMLDARDDPFPGRAVARQRRDAARAGQRHQGS